MKRIVTAEHMKKLDTDTISRHHMDQMVLMERAAMAVVKHLQQFDLSRTLVVCGCGNNGGDGIAIGRMLHLAGFSVSIYLVGNRSKMSTGCAKQYEIAQSYGIRWVNNPEYSEYTTIVDAIFGVGLSRAVSGSYAQVIDEINQSPATVVSVDMPSGICADTGRVLGCAVYADCTVTFAYEKAGQCLYPGKEYCGSLYTEDIGIYDTEELQQTFPEYWKLEKEDLNLIPLRLTSGNKGTFGKVLLIAGSKDMPGASVLCGQAVLRTGAGMLKVVAPIENRDILATILPEAMLAVYDSKEKAIQQIADGFLWADVVVMGPGIGQGDTAQAMVDYVLKNCSLPLVLDADGINLTSCHMEWLKERRNPCIMTPHMGELARLLQMSVAQVKENLFERIPHFAKEYQVQCVCKDAVTCVVLPKQTIYINSTGNCGLATAGSGDVLAGVIGGLLAVGTPLEYAGGLGSYLHGMAGDRLAEKNGTAHMIAGDLIEELASFRIGEKEVQNHESI